MRGLPTIAGLALAAVAAPAYAGELDASERDAVAAAVTGFMDAIASDDKTLLALHMIPEAMIFIHNQMDPENPRVDVVPVAQHLERWAARTGDYEENMRYDVVEVSGDMAQVWGPYSFTYNGTLTHCGVNSISLVRGKNGMWKVGNTSFTMVPAARCGEVGADWVIAE